MLMAIKLLNTKNSFRDMILSSFVLFGFIYQQTCCGVVIGLAAAPPFGSFNIYRLRSILD